MIRGKTLTGVLAWMLFLVCYILPAAPVFGAGTETPGAIGFYVRAILPQNQRDRSLSYFDLRMKPGQTQELLVEIVNETAEPLTVRVEAISASTNRNGVIDYKTPEIRDITLEHPFAELVWPVEETLKLAPGSRTNAVIRVTMPEMIYDGVILGGLVFTKLDTDNEPVGTGAVVRNVYSYVIGVVLNETGEAVAPDFELAGIEAQTVNYYPAMVHQIRNRAAAIAKNIDIYAVVKNEQGEVAAELTKSGADMAPNSVMPLALTPIAKEKSQPSGQLAAGTYTTEIRLEYEGREWLFTQQFTIGSTAAKQINAAMPADGSKSDRQIRWFVGGLVLLNILLLLCIIWLLARRKERRRKDEDETVHQCDSGS